jgi:hypothetical protein
VGNRGGQRCLAGCLGGIVGEERAERGDAHGGSVAPGAVAVEEGGGQGPPVGAVADQAEQPAGRRPVAPVEVVPPGEGGGEGVLVDRAVDGQGQVNRAGHLRVVGPLPGPRRE